MAQNDLIAGPSLWEKFSALYGFEHLMAVNSIPAYATGCIVATNDGELARFLNHPAAKMDRVFVVKCQPPIDVLLAEEINRKGLHINHVKYEGIHIQWNAQWKSRSLVLIKLMTKELSVVQVMHALNRRVTRICQLTYGPFSVMKGGGRAKRKQSRMRPCTLREIAVSGRFLQGAMSAVWEPFIERDWPFFRRRRVTALKKKARLHMLTSSEVKELNSYSMEELHGLDVKYSSGGGDHDALVVQKKYDEDLALVKRKVKEP